ncbi:hypothetical protein [Microseira wollei]|uniref:Transposase n=1 Tax=Microseira wollei NIES-4236 TaxID=2530354 RepID=A0AAV3XP58_9CYAN|nr:hypothetical protein [Microseira wollei]GET43438.1 hypothetical protein MiSe_82610 [Microseira wollei NIES-4236]
MITESADNTPSKLINQWWNMPPLWLRGLIVIFANQVAKMNASSLIRSNVFILVRSWILNLSRVFRDLQIGDIPTPIV